jgi:L-lactate dehydrogenase complex protein LldG
MAVLSAKPELLDRFTAALRELRAEAHEVPTEGETPGILRSIVDGHRATRVVVANVPSSLRPLVGRAFAGLSVQFLEEVRPADVVRACASADVGLTWAEYGVAEEGAIVETAYDDVARLAASLPIVHVVLMSTGRLVRDVGEGMSVAGEILRTSDPGRRPTITFISGPSRTGDIELRLLYGVHGPHSLHVMLLDWFDGR